MDQQTQIEKLQQEVEQLRKEGEFKDKCIQSYIDEEKAFEQEVRSYNIQLKKQERKIMGQVSKLIEINEKTQAKKADILEVESKFNRTMQNCQLASLVLQKHKEKEEGYQKQWENMQTKMQELNKEYANLKLKSQTPNDKAELVKQANERDEKKISELTLMQKRAEIKTASLENELKRKTDECVALSAILDQF